MVVTLDRLHPADRCEHTPHIEPVESREPPSLYSPPNALTREQ